MLKDVVFLTQTDTTIGFVSQNAERLTGTKQRAPHKHYIRAVNSLRTLHRLTRVPSKYKNRVRRQKKTTFIFPNGLSYRIIRDPHHLLLLNRLTWAYTSSANVSNAPYDEAYAKRVADVIITPLRETTQASHIYKLGNKVLKKVR